MASAKSYISAMVPNSDTVRRTIRRLIPAALAVVLSLAAIGFLVATVLLAFLEIMTAPFATLSTAAVLAVVAGVLFIISRSGRKRRRRMARTSVLDELLPALNLAAGQKPLAALTAAAVLGAVTEIVTKNGGAQRRRD